MSKCCPTYLDLQGSSTADQDWKSRVPSFQEAVPLKSFPNTEPPVLDVTPFWEATKDMKKYVKKQL